MKIARNIPLNRHSSFNLGGKADYFVSVTNIEELIKAIKSARMMGIPFLVAGGFSNMLFSDEGFRGLIIRNDIKGYEFFEKNGNIFVSAGAGESWDSFVKNMIKRGLYGLENLSGIPGSVGATPIQNVGAYGREVSDMISWVEVLNTETLEREILTNRQCNFGYRDSFFKSQEGKKFIVLEVGFKLQKEGVPDIKYKDLKNYFNDSGERPTPASVRDAVMLIRSKKFPDLSKVGCGGSFFKNPIVNKEILENLLSKHEGVPHYEMGDGTYKVPLAYILEHVVPWKGVNRKTVGVHSEQPIVLVHYGGGSANELKKLSDEIQHTVSKETNILITPEISFVGKF
jgi:UDP-N-acetylmuramate dehydrogenase